MNERKKPVLLLQLISEKFIWKKKLSPCDVWFAILSSQGYSFLFISLTFCSRQFRWPPVQEDLPATFSFTTGRLSLNQQTIKSTTKSPGLEPRAKSETGFSRTCLLEVVVSSIPLLLIFLLTATQRVQLTLNVKLVNGDVIAICFQPQTVVGRFARIKFWSYFLSFAMPSIERNYAKVCIQLKDTFYTEMQSIDYTQTYIYILYNVVLRE